MTTAEGASSDLQVTLPDERPPQRRLFTNLLDRISPQLFNSTKVEPTRHYAKVMGRI